VNEECIETFTEFVNSELVSQFKNYRRSVIFGQNISAGSRISGLGNKLEEISGCRVINSTNSENSLIGMGFGLSLMGIPSLFLMKQHDFSLLGLDQLVNTHNVLRQGRLIAPFVILMVVVDSGFEGPQATLNSLDEYASLSKADVHLLSTKESIESAFNQSLEPGLHLLALGQSNMKKKLVKAISPIKFQKDVVLYQNIEMPKPTIAIVFYGVNIGIGLETANKLKNMKIGTDLFVICKISNSEHNADFIDTLQKYSEVIIIDTGKSDVHYSSKLAFHLSTLQVKVKIFERTSMPTWSEVSEDSPEFDAETIATYVQSGKH